MRKAPRKTIANRKTKCEFARARTEYLCVFLSVGVCVCVCVCVLGGLDKKCIYHRANKTLPSRLHRTYRPPFRRIQTEMGVPIGQRENRVSANKLNNRAGKQQILIWHLALKNTSLFDVQCWPVFLTLHLPQFSHKEAKQLQVKSTRNYYRFVSDVFFLGN